jgi:hypothetical protein
MAPSLRSLFPAKKSGNPIPSTPKVSPLRSLLAIIQKSVDEIENAFEERGFDFPSIDDPPSERDALRLDPSVQAATALLTSAAYQVSMSSSAQMWMSGIDNISLL